MTSLVLLLAIAIFTLVTGVGTIVTFVRYWPPSMDSDTQKRVARALNRGGLPDVEPDRSLAERTAQGRVKNIWLVLSPLGVAALMIHSALGPSVVPAPMYVAVSSIALLAAALSGFLWLQARRALAASPRRADAT